MRGRPAIHLDDRYHYSRDLEARDLRKEVLGDVLRRPLARARPADLAVVREVSDQLAARDSEPVGLLLACLEHRFGFDVGVGSGRPMTSGQDDIAL